VAAAAALVATGEARAAEPVTKPVELRHDLRLELPVTAGLAAAVVGVSLVRDDLEPSRCRWCDGPEGSGEVNAVDDWFRSALRRRDTRPANLMSHILALGAAPAGAVGLTALAAAADGRGDEMLVDAVAIAEGTLGAVLVAEIVQSVTLRTRPYVHAMADEDVRAAEIATTGAFHSFPSAHVVTAFGLASAAGVVASKRGYRLAPLVWTAGLMLGVATAYTRIAADRHWFTDTLAGAAIGVAVGGGVPLLFHRPVRPGARAGLLDRARLAVAPLPRGQMVSVSWAF
jgi:membrane-associated phospholipid phosphatase